MDSAQSLPLKRQQLIKEQKPDLSLKTCWEGVQDKTSSDITRANYLVEDEVLMRVDLKCCETDCCATICPFASAEFST